MSNHEALGPWPPTPLRRYLRPLFRLGLPLLLILAPPVPPKTATAAGTFSGRYVLTLTFGASCPQRGPTVRLSLDVAESPARHGSPAVLQGTEVAAQPSDPADAQTVSVVLLRRGEDLEGGIAARYGEAVLTLEGLRVSMNLLGSGTAQGAGTARPQVSGRAFGDLMLSRPEDDQVDALAFCAAGDHTFSLAPEGGS
jgi:hypothetical protein